MYAPTERAASNTIFFSSFDNLYGSVVASLCLFDLKSFLALILFVDASILPSMTIVRISKSNFKNSCSNKAASNFHSD